jgi:hypothetical protein
MRLGSPFPVMAIVAGAVILGASSPARASMELKLESGSTSTLLTEANPGNGIFYSNTSFAGDFSLTMLSAESNSSFDGPTVFSELDLQSFTLKNLTGSQQTLTLTLSDVGFDPNTSARPLVVYNSASATFSQGTSGSLTFQTFAFDGTGYFQTSGPGTVSTDPVILTPASSGSTTTADFSPQNAQFSLTNVMTITLDPGASIAGFTGVSLVHAPEPGALALVFIGLISLGVGHRLRRRGGRA